MPGPQIVESSRGTAFGDIDGDLDPLVTNMDEAPDFLIHFVKTERWDAGCPGGVGEARGNASRTAPADRQRREQVGVSGSRVPPCFLPRPFSAAPGKLEVRWLDGKATIRTGPPVDREVAIRREGGAEVR